MIATGLGSPVFGGDAWVHAASEKLEITALKSGPADASENIVAKSSRQRIVVEAGL